MRLSTRDITASVLVGAAVLIYVCWTAGLEIPGMADVRATGAVLLALGFLASASAVVPTFVELLHGDRGYLIVSALIGTVAAVAGVHLLVTASEVSLAVLMVAMVVLWLMTTVHHRMLATQAGAARPDYPSESPEWQTASTLLPSGSRTKAPK